MTDDDPFRNVVEATEPKPAYRCPCRKSKTLCGCGGYEICPVCFWEDDGLDEHHVDLVRGGPNGTLSLRQARDSYRQYGASAHRFVTEVRQALPDER